MLKQLPTLKPNHDAWQAETPFNAALNPILVRR